MIGFPLAATGAIALLCTQITHSEPTRCPQWNYAVDSLVAESLSPTSMKHSGGAGGSGEGDEHKAIATPPAAKASATVTAQPSKVEGGSVLPTVLPTEYNVSEQHAARFQRHWAEQPKPLPTYDTPLLAYVETQSKRAGALRGRGALMKDVLASARHAARSRGAKECTSLHVLAAIVCRRGGVVARWLTAIADACMPSLSMEWLVAQLAPFCADHKNDTASAPLSTTSCAGAGVRVGGAKHEGAHTTPLREEPQKLESSLVADASAVTDAIDWVALQVEDESVVPTEAHLMWALLALEHNEAAAVCLHGGLPCSCGGVSQPTVAQCGRCDGRWWMCGPPRVCMRRWWRKQSTASRVQTCPTCGPAWNVACTRFRDGTFIPQNHGVAARLWTPRGRSPTRLALRRSWAVPQCAVCTKSSKRPDFTTGRP